MEGLRFGQIHAHRTVIILSAEKLVIAASLFVYIYILQFIYHHSCDASSHLGTTCAFVHLQIDTIHILQTQKNNTTSPSD